MCEITNSRVRKEASDYRAGEGDPANEGKAGEGSRHPLQLLFFKQQLIITCQETRKSQEESDEYAMYISPHVAKVSQYL
jgi:hypothetical protein